MTLIRFSDRLLAPVCCTDERDGQVHLVTCTETGAQMIWSPSEVGTYDSAVAEHHAAHDKLRAKQDAARQYAIAAQQARWIWAHTEPGDPARRGINAYLNYSG